MNVDYKDETLRTKIREVLNESNEKNNSSTGCVNFIGVGHVISGKNPRCLKILWAAIILTCLGLCFYQTYDRINYYFTDPIKIVINIVERPNLSLPALNFCFYDIEKLWKLKKKGGVTDTLDLIDKNVNANKLWNTAGKIQSLMKLNDFNPLNALLITNEMLDLNITKIPQTTCRYVGPRYINGTRVDIKYSGTMSVATFIVLIKTHLSLYKNPEVYLNEAEMNVNPVMGRKFPIHQLVSFLIQTKLFKAINTHNKPCIPLKERADCYNKCYNDKLAGLKCWLPFMHLNMSRECKTSTEAKEVRDQSLFIYRTVNPEEECGCTRACEQPLYIAKVESIQKPFVNDIELFIGFQDNFIEEVSEEEAYSLIQLLCDVGGNLGLYLGLSVLSLIDALQSGVDTAEEKIDNKKKVKPQ